MPEKSVAILTIFDAANMSAKGRRNIAKWLDRQKALVLNKKESSMLAKRYTARYLYRTV